MRVEVRVAVVRVAVVRVAVVVVLVRTMQGGTNSLSHSAKQRNAFDSFDLYGQKHYDPDLHNFLQDVWSWSSPPNWQQNIFWLVVSTHLKNISQNGNLPQIGMKIKNI